MIYHIISIRLLIDKLMQYTELYNMLIYFLNINRLRIINENFYKLRSFSRQESDTQHVKVTRKDQFPWDEPINKTGKSILKLLLDILQGILEE